MEASSTGAKDGFEGKYGYFNVAIIILSIYVLVVLFLDTFVQFPDRTSKLISRIDWFICGIFFIDWVVRFRDAESKLKFMRWGWIDLIACMHALPFIRAGRLFGLIRLLRLVRAFKSIKQFVHHFFANRAEGAFFSALIISFLIMLICSISILQVEVDPRSTIKTADDALWWSYFTLTTGSYVDVLRRANQFDRAIERYEQVINQVTDISLNNLLKFERELSYQGDNQSYKVDMKLH